MDDNGTSSTTTPNDDGSQSSSTEQSDSDSEGNADGEQDTSANTGSQSDPEVDSDGDNNTESDSDTDADEKADSSDDSETDETSRSDVDSDADTYQNTNSESDSNTAKDTGETSDSDTEHSGDTDTASDGGTLEGCPRYVTSLATCPYQLYIDDQGCEAIRCLDEPCKTDGDCSQDDAPYCVAGNCAFCWDDSLCGEGELCRGGRCVVPDMSACPEPPPCTQDGCNLVSLSEDPCPVCVCSVINGRIPCETDGECQSISVTRYSHCVNGACAECRNDDQCGMECFPPGICSYTSPPNMPHASFFYGTWLVGTSTALNHMSYFRFEPDGTLRRGHYESNDVWKDDTPVFPCTPKTPIDDAPLMGIWQKTESAAGFMLGVTLNMTCDEGSGFSAGWLIQQSTDGQIVTMDTFDATHRVDTSSCTPAFDSCVTPTP